MRRIFFRCASLCALGFLLTPSAGCGPSQVTLSGKVTFDGTPLPGGLITFRPVDSAQNAVPARIDEEGNYEAVVPVGEILVSIDNSSLAPRDSAPPALPPAMISEMSPAARAKLVPKTASASSRSQSNTHANSRYVKIPERYFNVETSDLKFTVQAGVNKKDFLLTK